MVGVCLRGDLRIGCTVGMEGSDGAGSSGSRAVGAVVVEGVGGAECCGAGDGAGGARAGGGAGGATAGDGAGGARVGDGAGGARAGDGACGADSEGGAFFPFPDPADFFPSFLTAAFLRLTTGAGLGERSESLGGEGGRGPTTAPVA